MSNSSKDCSFCYGSGVVKASLVKKEIEGKTYKIGVDVVLCKEHFSIGEETMSSMEEDSNLPLNVVGVQGAN
jgi:hypothetical protein